MHRLMFISPLCHIPVRFTDVTYGNKKEKQNKWKTEITNVITNIN